MTEHRMKRFADYLREDCRPWRTQLPKVAAHLLEGGLPGPFEGLSGDGRAHVLNDAFVWVLSDTPEARMQWEVLAGHGRPAVADRDAYAADLWARIVNGGDAAFAGYRRLLDESLGVREHYERSLFRWFLARFDLVRARRVFGTARLAAVLHWLLLALAVVAVWASFQIVGVTGRAAVLVTGCAVALLIAGKFLSGLPFFAYLQSLVPRLGATVAIGYLFLAAAPELVRVIYEQGLPAAATTADLVQWALAGAAILGTTAYAALHIHRRVQPTLRPGVLWGRAANLVAVALFYAVLGLGVAAPLLFHRSLLYPHQPPPGGAPGPHQLALCAAIALSLGVVLQLAWEEKPLTEPL